MHDQKLQFSLIFLSCILAACSVHLNNGVQGNGDLREERRRIGNFDRLKNPSIIDVKLTREDGPLIVRTDSNLISLVKTKVNEKTLTLGLKENVSDYEALKVVVPVKQQQLKAIEFDGTGDLEGKTSLEGDELKVANDGTGNMELEFELDKLEYDADGTGDAEFSGNAEHFRVANSGTGDVKAFELKAGEAQCKSSGTGDIEVHATGELYVQLTGTGDITYEGDPDLKDVSIDGTGDLEER